MPASLKPGRQPAADVHAFRRRALLAGASLLALGTLGSTAEGGGLRDRGNVVNPAAYAIRATTTAAQETAAATAQAMGRMNTSLRAMRDVQAAARAAAQSAASAVPNGLAPGGLVVAPGATPSPTDFGNGLWQGAKLPEQGRLANGRTQVLVKQTDQKAILTWQSFNIGRETDLYFDQTAGGSGAANWIALNRVLDPGTSPSRILGAIKAEGQVYVINRNGIIFGGSSQVDVNTLVASSLSLSNQQLQAGINGQLFILNDSTGGSIAMPTFGYLGQQPPNFRSINDPLQTPGAEIGAPPGEVRTEVGAQIATQNGGKALLFAPRVTNAGHISAPDGQVIMAAGEQVYLRTSGAYREDEFAVRGLDVAVSAPMRWVFNNGALTGANGDLFTADVHNIILPEMAARAASVGYRVTNTGIVQADRGDITVMARDIMQNGAMIATTALNNREGSIRLRAWAQGMMAYGGEIAPLQYWSTGTVTLGSGSVTRVTPDLDDTSEIEEAALTTRYKAGRIELHGQFVDIQSRASVLVPAGTIKVIASTSAMSGDSPAATDPQRDGSRVYIGEDAYLSVAGLLDVSVDLMRNLITGEFRINELRDSPLYRDSWLRGKKITVDRRMRGTFTDGPMAGVNWTGTPGEWVGTPLGDFSGWIGIGKTDLAELSTKGGSIAIKAGGAVITRRGSLLDVSGGSVRYSDGVLNTTKLLGADGRVYDIGSAMPDQIYVGIPGEFTRTHGRAGLVETWTSKLRAGRRVEKGYAEGRDAGSIQFYAAEAIVLEGDYAGGTVVGERQFATGKFATSGTLRIGDGADSSRVWLPGDLTVTAAPILLPEDFTATTPLDAFWYDKSDPVEAFRAKRTFLDPAVLARSGMGTFEFYLARSFNLGRGETLELNPGTKLSIVANVAGTWPATFFVDGTIRIAGGSVLLEGARASRYGSGTVIDVRGQWVNDRSDSMPALPPVINGGTITVDGDFESGAVLDVSGGAWLKARGGAPSLQVGDAGQIMLGVRDGRQLVGLDLRGYAAGSGGDLSVRLGSAVQVGGVAPADPNVSYLPGTLFAERGFREFSVGTSADITVPDGAVIVQTPVNLDLGSVDLGRFASGTPLTEMASPVVLPLTERAKRKPTSLGLSGVNVTIGTGAVVRTDVGGSVNLQGSGDVVVRGTIEAPGGSIEVGASRTVRLADGARLLARGVPVIEVDPQGIRSGKVLDGGTVMLDGGAAIKTDAGSLIDVSGTSGEIDTTTSASSRPGDRPLRLASNGGTVILDLSGDQDAVEGRLLGYAGGDGAVGGTIDVRAIGLAVTTPAVTLPLRLYYRDRANGQIKSITTTGNLDIYKEYTNGADVAYRLLNFRSTLTNLTTGLVRKGGVVIVDPDADTLPDAIITPLEKLNPAVANQLDLLQRYFYLDANATERIVLPSKTLNFGKVSVHSLSKGGFADLKLSGSPFIVAPGVDLTAGRSISITTAISSGGAGTASIRAPYISISSGALPPIDPAGAGRIAIKADVIDVGNALFYGFAETQLTAREIRLGGLLADVQGTRTSSITTDGQLLLKAGQIYPGTGVTASIKATTKITIEANGEAGLPLSAGGQLTLEAPVIEQNGVLRAPFGSITLKATSRITLGGGSITSVSGDGLVLPYGTLSNNQHWIDPTNPLNTMAALPNRAVVLDAPTVNLATGSVVDVRGGGDLYAWEHVPGPGGSHDVLATPGTYAIVPAFANATAPGGGAAIGDRIWLAGGGGVAAGWYTLLPARYALLPGAYAVSMVKGTQGSDLPKSVALSDGSVIMGGHRGNAFGGEEQIGSAWRVMSGAVLRRYSEYNEAFANGFFASDAFKLAQYRLTGKDIVTPRLPMDGGSLVLKATQELILNGQMQSQAAAGGRGGLMDIAASKVAIVGAGQDASAWRAGGYLVVDSSSLSGFGAGSLLVGGTRSGDARGLRVDVVASDIVVRNNEATELAGPEIILAASGTVDIGAGSVVVAKGDAPTNAGDLVMAPQVKAVTGEANGGANDGNPNNDVLLTPSKDYGALVRVSNGDAVRVIRENVDTTIGGIVRIGENARVDGGKSLLIDATRNTIVASAAQLSGEALSLASGRIGFGGGSQGLILDAASLARLAQTQNLTLRSYSSIDFYTSVNFGGAGLRAVTLDAAGFVGYGTNAIAVTGDTIALKNSGGTVSEPVGTGHGQLTLSADELVLGIGSKILRGFDGVTLSGATRIIGEDNGALDAGAAGLTLATPVLTGRGGASQSVVTAGALVVTGTGDADPADQGLGTRISLTGGSVTFSGRIAALGGAVDMTATSGHVVLTDGSLIDVGGRSKQFFDVTGYADAGRIGLTAVGGNVLLSNGAVLNLAASAGGGNAGKLAVTAAGGGTVVLDGRIAAQAGAGGKGGSFALDIAQLPDFAGLSRTLNDAGFNASRQFRIRNGSVVVDGVTTVAEFVLSADQGSVTLAGLIDASSPYGGHIAISGGNGLVMRSSAVLRAGSTTELGSGRVTLEAGHGRLDLQGGAIDVPGGEGGRVRLRALQNATHDGIAVDRLDATVAGARSAVLEGVSVYDTAGSVHASGFDGTSVESVMAEAVAHANTFAGNATSILGAIPGGGSFTLAAGIEIRGAGDLTLGTDWNLAGLASREGTLSLRAAGNLVIKGNISDGFSTADRSGTLLDAASWSLRLVAGADLQSANALALAPIAGLPAGKGSLIVGDATAGKLVRTGTGDIEVRAGRDLQLGHYESVIYTAGRRDMTVWSDFTAPAGASYGVLGGHLDIVAQGNVSSALPADPKQNQLFTEWLNRGGATDTSYVFSQQSTWWVDYGAFKQGVGALGGGNVAVEAGGDLVNMLVALPTNGRVRGGRTAIEQKSLEMRNGGAMTVEAGGAVRAGYYYVGRGAGTITAGELTTGRNVVVTWQGRQDVLPIAPVLALGDATLSVKTAGDLTVQTVLDPLLLNNGNGQFGSYMSGYSDRTALDLVSVGGDLVLVNQAQFLSKNLVLTDPWHGADVPFALLTQLSGNLYPSMTRLTALNGSVENRWRFFTMPGARPELRILAENDVSPGEIVMSRATLEMLPSPLRPVGGNGAFVQLSMSGQADNPLQDQGFQRLLVNDIGVSTFFTGTPHNGYLISVSNPAHLLNEADFEPSRIYANSGSIIGSEIVRTGGTRSFGSITTNEQTWFRAGTDIRNIDYRLRNVRGSDVSVLEAGNDIIGGPIQGSVTVQGAGALVVSAGRDVYSPSLKLYSGGNQAYDGNNRPLLGSQIFGLPDRSAAITVMAGLQGRQLLYEAFLAAYVNPRFLAAMPSYLTFGPSDVVLPDPTALKPGVTMTSVIGDTTVPIYLTDQYRLVQSKYSDDSLIRFVAGQTGRTLPAEQALEVFRQMPAATRQTYLLSAGTWKATRYGVVSFIGEVSGETLAPQAAWERFQTLPALTRERFARQVYMQELREAGSDQLEPGVNGLPRNGGYNRGYAAIETLFPGKDWKGDVSIGSAFFRTMAGGDIEVLTPGGGLQVAALGTVVPDGHGLVTLGYGNVNVFAHNNVTVNRSRILTFAGGDEIIWSTVGDIDAGRGAKTTRVPSAADVLTDVDAVTRILERADMSGSGIGTIIGFTGVEEGDVHLIAPEGTVNAGDAGIRVSGNLTLAARFVLNIDNIQVGGQTKGIAKVEAKVAPLSVETKDKAAADAVSEATRMPPAERPSVIIVEILGYGGGEGRDQDNQNDQRQRRGGGSAGEQRSQRTDGPVQVLGAGEMSAEEARQLLAEHRRRAQP